MKNVIGMMLALSMAVNTVAAATEDGVKVVVAKRDRKSTRLNSSHSAKSRMPSSA